MYPLILTSYGTVCNGIFIDLLPEVHVNVCYIKLLNVDCRGKQCFSKFVAGCTKHADIKNISLRNVFE